jgi:HAD superfamily hydrolase (TIGR01459 family)
MTHGQASIPIIDGIAALAPRYEAWLCDIWGVVHNGIAAFPAACDALRRYRGQGGKVVLLTNAPRPSNIILGQLERLHVPREAFDMVITSGDVTRGLIERSGKAVYHIGPQRDLPVFEGLGVRLVEERRAEVIVCTGLFDDHSETPADYAALLGRLKERGLRMICANPDRKVERGTEIIYCAGAIADAYEALGGAVEWAGKPYMPVYDLALANLSSLKGGRIDKPSVLAIGDGLKTDMAGAAAAGLDAVFVPSGVHVSAKGPLQARVLEELFAPLPYRPIAALGALRW